MSKRFIYPTLSGPWSLVFLISLIGLLGAPAHAQIQPKVVALERKNVLVLHALEANMPLNVRTDRAIIAALEAGGIGMRNQFFEYLDLQRNPGSEHRKRLAEMMYLRYSKRKIDVIITLYPEALEFLLKDCLKIFPEAPIVALYMAPGIVLPKTGHRIVQHVFRCDMKGTLEIALKFFPKAKYVYVVGGVHALDKKNEKQAREDFKKWEGQLTFRYLSDMSLEEMLRTVSSAPPEAIIFYMAMTGDITGKTYNPRDVAKQLRQVSKGPVFGLYETLLEHGIIGGSIVRYGDTGTQAGKLALSILGIGSDPDKTSEIIDVPGVPMFDWRELRHWKLSESALPKGSIVINKETMLWDFRYYIIGAMAFFLAETALILFLIVQGRRKRAAEKELDQFFNVNLDILCIANFDGYFLRLNPAAEKVLGHTREELMAKRFLDFVHPEDLARTQEAVSALASQQKLTSFENRYRCKDGTYRWLEWSATPVGNLIYAAARDITEPKRMQEALKERLRFEQLLSGLSARFVNIPSDRVDFEIDYGLRQVLEFFQVDRVGLIRSLPDGSGHQITHAVYGEDVPPIPLGVKLPRSLYPWVFQKLVEKYEIVSFSRLDDLPPEANVDKQTYAKWGIRSALDIPIIKGGPIVYAIAINSVKSERIWSEELFPRLQLLGEIFVNALERKEIRLQIEDRLRFESLISDLSASFVNLPPDKVESEINEGLRSITELFDADRCTIELFSEDGTRLVRAFEHHSAEVEPGPESMSKEGMPWHMDQMVRGRPVVINRVEDLPPEAEKERQFFLIKGMKSVLSIPLLSGGKTLGSFSLVSTRSERAWPKELIQRLRLISEVFANVLHRKRAEAEAFQARQELLQLDRLSRMGELTASLAHELNQPFTAILSNAQAGLRFLQSGKVDLEEFRNILNDIIQDDQRAGNVIRSLRSMMKREEVERNPVILNNILNDVVQIFHTESIFRNVRIETELEESVPLVLGDKVQLQQVGLNLLLNAADAVSHHPPEQRKIILRTLLNGDRARVTVQDLGPGIDKENLERIFEPFFTTKGAGLGMGLAVCRTIVEAHGGRIWAENNEDGGATFVIELPVIK